MALSIPKTRLIKEDFPTPDYIFTQIWSVIDVTVMRTHQTKAKNSESVWNQLLRNGLIIIEITRFWTVLRMSSIVDSVCMVGERQLWSCNASWILYGRAWQKAVCISASWEVDILLIKYTDILIQFGVNSQNYLTQNNQQVEGSTKVQHLFSRKIELRPAPCHRISTTGKRHLDK